MLFNKKNPIDKRAESRWGRSDISFKNYQEYINRKSKRFYLDIVDLLYISNFKGGYATINECEEKIKKKLLAYSDCLIEIDHKFGDKSIFDLSEKEIDILIYKIKKLTEFISLKHKHKINGFGISYLSALMNAYFPELIPIIDRRVLINLDIVEEKDITKQGQIKNIQKFYPNLIKKIYSEYNGKNKNLRQIDKELFRLKIQ